jgi:hypothetical protein
METVNMDLFTNGAATISRGRICVKASLLVLSFICMIEESEKYKDEDEKY